jgi:hypothetical protein
MSKLIEDLAAGCPPDMGEIGWADDLRITWLARLLTLVGYVRRSLPSEDTSGPNMEELPLSKEDRFRIAVEQRMNRLSWLGRRCDDRERLERIDDVLALLEGKDAGPSWRPFLSRRLQDRAELCLKLGDARGGAEALRRAARFEDHDQAMREVLIDAAEELETAFRESPCRPASGS